MQDRCGAFIDALRVIDLAYHGGSLGRTIATHMAAVARAMPEAGLWDLDALLAPASSLPSQTHLRAALRKPLAQAVSRLRHAEQSDAHWEHFIRTAPAQSVDRHDAEPPPLERLTTQILARPLRNVLAYTPADLELRPETWRPGETVRTGIGRPRRRSGVCAAREVTAWHAASWLLAEERPLQMRAFECLIATSPPAWVEAIIVRHTRSQLPQPLALIHALGPPRERPFDRLAGAWRRVFDKLLAQGRAHCPTPLLLVKVGRPHVRGGALGPAAAAAVWDALYQIEGIDPTAKPVTAALLPDPRTYVSLDELAWAGPILRAQWSAAVTIATRQIRSLGNVVQSSRGECTLLHLER
jgi:hypothetical protein